MELEQIEQLYKAMAFGWLKNTFNKPKLADLDTYVPMLKRLFRDYCNEKYEVDVITHSDTTPEDWENWTVASIAAVQ